MSPRYSPYRLSASSSSISLVRRSGLLSARKRVVCSEVGITPCKSRYTRRTNSASSAGLAGAIRSDFSRSSRRRSIRSANLAASSSAERDVAVAAINNVIMRSMRVSHIGSPLILSIQRSAKGRQVVLITLYITVTASPVTDMLFCLIGRHEICGDLVPSFRAGVCDSAFARRNGIRSVFVQVLLCRWNYTTARKMNCWWRRLFRSILGSPGCTSPVRLFNQLDLHHLQCISYLDDPTWGRVATFHQGLSSSDLTFNS